MCPWDVIRIGWWTRNHRTLKHSKYFQRILHKHSQSIHYWQPRHMTTTTHTAETFLSVTIWIHHSQYRKSNSTQCTEHSWPSVLTNPQEPTKSVLDCWKQPQGNYRPISVLCTLSKILKRHVHDSLYTYLMSHNMHDGQSSFGAKHSCETALNHMVRKY